MRRLALLLALSAAPFVGACRSSTDPVAAACPTGATCVTGTVQRFTIEGGFWAVRGDDGTTYDPAGGLPAEYQRDGLRVHLTARVRNDLASFHMVGPIVDVVAIRPL